MNHFLASYMDALSRSNSGILIEKDHTLYCAIPSLDVPLVVSWMELQKSIFPNLRICGIYSSENVNLLDIHTSDKMYYIIKNIVYKVVWLHPKVKELGYYTTPISKLDLSVDQIQYKPATLDDLSLSILKNLENLDLKGDSRFLLNALNVYDLQASDIKDLLREVTSQIRMEGAKSF
jgi:hypothetical protein